MAAILGNVPGYGVKKYTEIYRGTESVAASLVEAGGTHFKTKLSSVATNISRGEVTERQLLDSLCVHLQNRDIWHRWSRLDACK